MDKLQIVPFGRLERFQIARRLKKEPHLRSSIITRWETIAPIMDEMLTTFPQIKGRIQEAIRQRDREILVSRGEYDVFGSLLDKINEKWQPIIDAHVKDVKERVGTWRKGSRRGMFRLVVLLIAALFERECSKAGKTMIAKGLGGAIKSSLEKASGKSMTALPGSLYAALNDFEADGLIANYQGTVAPDAHVSITVKGFAFIVEALKTIKVFIDVLGKTGLFSILKQECISSVKPLVETMLGEPIPAVDVTMFTVVTSELPKWIEKLTANPAFKDLPLGAVQDIIAWWQDNTNRGLLDIFLLGRYLVGPNYGNALINDASESLGFQAGTLYPKIKDYIEGGLLCKITDEDHLDALLKKSTKNQGPPKLYHDITFRGAFAFIAILALFMGDLNVILNLARDLIERVTEPVPPSKP